MMAILAPKIWNDNFKRRERNMSVTTVKGRISNKHGTEAEWTAAGTAANPFIPLSGELIIYDPDVNFAYCRFKFGDGVTKVH
jgi:hypothetical protein